MSSAADTDVPVVAFPAGLTCAWCHVNCGRAHRPARAFGRLVLRAALCACSPPHQSALYCDSASAPFSM
eukprot:6181119-Pleurochrysis_carterae.AAC.2